MSPVSGLSGPGVPRGWGVGRGLASGVGFVGPVGGGCWFGLAWQAGLGLAGRFWVASWGGRAAG
jgi:hypothetical protein